MSLRSSNHRVLVVRSRRPDSKRSSDFSVLQPLGATKGEQRCLLCHVLSDKRQKAVWKMKNSKRSERASKGKLNSPQGPRYVNKDAHIYKPVEQDTRKGGNSEETSLVVAVD